MSEACLTLTDICVFSMRFMFSRFIPPLGLFPSGVLSSLQTSLSSPPFPPSSVVGPSALLPSRLVLSPSRADVTSPVSGGGLEMFSSRNRGELGSSLNEADKVEVDVVFISLTEGRLTVSLLKVMGCSLGVIFGGMEDGHSGV